MRRVIVTGGAGYLGEAVVAAAPGDWECHVTERRTPPPRGIRHPCDLADAEAVVALWSRLRPELVIHTAYGTENGERDIWLATRNVVDATLAVGADLLHTSTDLVFDGESGPYGEDAEPSPVHEYGQWKTRAERYVRERAPAAAVVRASLITSFDPPDPRTAWVLAGLKGEEEVTLFVDEIRTPILRDDLAAQIVEICQLPTPERSGVWHLAGPESLSRYAIGALVASAYRLSTQRLRAARSPREPAAARPRDIRLLTRRADAVLSHRPRSLSEAAALASTVLAPEAVRK